MKLLKRITKIKQSLDKIGVSYVLLKENCFWIWGDLNLNTDASIEDHLTKKKYQKRLLTEPTIQKIDQIIRNKQKNILILLYENGTVMFKFNPEDLYIETW